MSFKNKLTVPQDGIVSVDTPNRDEFFKNALSDDSKHNVLGRGSYGTVVKATYKEKQVAVKIIDNQSAIKMWSLKNESNVLGWQHENIIKILKIVSTSKYSIVIMERFPGQCLQYVLDTIALPVIHRICISIDITNALIYCHDQGLIHLDVKPQNVLVAYLGKWKLQSTTDNQSFRSYICKLCDFGSSLKIEQTSFSKKNDSSNRGTIRYMSPEALKRFNITTASDIYSFGITIWQLKTRIYPYSSIESNDIVAYRVVKENLRPDHPSLFPYPADPGKFNTISLSSNQEKLLLSPTTHTNCICEHFSSDLSKRSFENLQNILETSKSLETSLSLFCLFDDHQRVPFMNLNKKLNVQSVHNASANHSKRYLSSIIDNNTTSSQLNTFSGSCNSSEAKTLQQYPKISIKITTENENFCNDFENTIQHMSVSSFEVRNIPKQHRKHSPGSSTVLKEIENDIELLYRSCWDEDLQKRPTALNIKNVLQNILMKISSN